MNLRFFDQGKKDFKSACIKVAVLCAGQIFGQEDVINMREYTTSVKCLSTNASVYCIKSDEFFARLSKDDKTWNQIIDLSYAKDLRSKKYINKVTKIQKDQAAKMQKGEPIITG